MDVLLTVLMLEGDIHLKSFRKLMLEDLSLSLCLIWLTAACFMCGLNMCNSHDVDYLNKVQILPFTLLPPGG